ncbi:hypothetical protein [Pedobacter nanyangensis]|uniref:hypothetical protein n=1 Tax=Pedobacter nanyangensis TaxID=1562389 RepID=UPI0013B42CD5|nr:hypothetical protein [Pedobacter nanyangensis]
MKNQKEELLTTSLTSVPLPIAKEMAKTFRKNHVRTDKDTKSVWFPVEQITAIANALKEEKADGIRVYFGQYTEDLIKKLNQITSAPEIPKDYANRNTVIFVSTREENGIKKTDYFTDMKHPMNPENRGELCPNDCPKDSPMLTD